MPKFPKNTGFRMKGYSYPGESPNKQLGGRYSHLTLRSNSSSPKNEKQDKESIMKDYALGFITAVAVMIALWSMSSPLQADGTYAAPSGPGGTRWDPIYVKVVD